MDSFKRHAEPWKEEKINYGEMSYIFRNMGNFVVNMELDQVAIVSFQLPRVDIDKRVFFNLFCKVYNAGFELGRIFGKEEFSKNLSDLVNYNDRELK